MVHRLRYALAAIGLLLVSLGAAAAGPAPGSVPAPSLPGVTVVTDGGAKVPFRDLIANRTVAINFIFTSCPTVCPLMGASFGKVQKLLGERDVALISVSVDPTTDTPARLTEWRKRFGGADGWTLVTGSQGDIDSLLKAFGVFTADPVSHSPAAFIADTRRGIWRKVDGLASPSTIVGVIDEVVKPSDHYLAHLPLVDQDGRRVDLYDDLIKGHTIVLNSFFASCTGSCPVMAKTFLLMQRRLGDRVGDDVILVSITVDPENDTPAKLKEYAERIGAKKGWYFLTGTPAQVDAALAKLGQYAEAREAHKNIIIAGNDRTGLWKKALAIAPSEDVWKVVESVVDDHPRAVATGSK